MDSPKHAPPPSKVSRRSDSLLPSGRSARRLFAHRRLTSFPRRLLKFVRLDRQRRALFFRAVALLWKHRIRLWAHRFHVSETSVGPADPSPSPSPPPSSHHWPSPGAIGWAVSAASHVVPRSTCLARALAAQDLCRRYAYPAQVRLGARRQDGGALEAHAWLELGEEVVVGGSQDLEEYSVFQPVAEQTQDPSGS